MENQVLSEPSRVLGNQEDSALVNGGLDTQMSVPASFLFKIIDDKSMVVKDSEGESIFSVKPCNTATHCQREVSRILSGVEHPSFNLQKQIATPNACCDGYSTCIENLRTYGKKLLNVSENGILQNHTDLNVKLHYTLLNNGASVEAELLQNDSYKIIGSWPNKTLIVYKPVSLTVIAQVRPGDTNDEFMVEVSSNDCALVVYLIAAVDCMKDPGTLTYMDIQEFSEPIRVLGNQEGSALANGGLDTQMFFPASFLFKITNDKSMVVKDSEGKSIFTVKSCNTASHCRRKVYQIVSGIEHPIFKIQNKIITAHDQCDGYSTSTNNIETYGQKLFSVSRCKNAQNHTNLKVKLLYMSPDNGASQENDSYKIVGSWSKKDFSIYKLGSSTAIAKVRAGDTNYEFMVEVSSNADRAFVISLIAAVDCMNGPGILKHAHKGIIILLEVVVGSACAAVWDVVSRLCNS